MFQCPELRTRIEETRDTEACAERLTQQLERDRRKQEPELPADAESSNHPPHVLVEIDEHERCELPDRFLRACLAKAAASEAASDCEGKGNQLTGDGRRDADEHADEGTGVRTRDQSRQERAFE